MMRIKKEEKPKKWTATLIFTTILVSFPLLSCMNELFIDTELFSPTDKFNLLCMLVSAVCSVLFLLLNEKIGNESTGEDTKRAQAFFASMGYATKKKEKRSIKKEIFLACILLTPLFYFGALLPLGKLFTNFYGTPYESNLIISKINGVSKICLHSPNIRSEQLNGFFIDRPLCISGNDYKIIKNNSATTVEVTGMKSIIGHNIKNYTVTEIDNQKNQELQNQKNNLINEWKNAP